MPCKAMALKLSIADFMAQNRYILVRIYRILGLVFSGFVA
jgi:hypothetical protein